MEERTRALLRRLAEADPIDAPHVLCGGAVGAWSLSGAALYVWEGGGWHLRSADGSAFADGAPRGLPLPDPQSAAALDPDMATGGLMADDTVVHGRAWGVATALLVRFPRWTTDGEEAARAALQTELQLAVDWAAAAEGCLRRQAPAVREHDEATGLSLDTQFMARVLQEVARAWRLRHSLALVRVAVRGLAAEAVRPKRLDVEVARILAEAARTEDVLGRLGEEEFAALLSGSDAAGAQSMAMRASTGIRKLSLETGVMLRMSAGIADLPTDAQDAATLRSAADRALYLAEAAGGDCVRLISSDVR